MIHTHEIVVHLCVEHEGLDLGRENRKKKILSQESKMSG
jgi:hypothetical protein